MSHIGNDNIGAMYLGDTKIAKAYLGDDLVYSSGPPLPYTPLTWVGSTGAETSAVRFDAGINLLSTMTFELDLHLATGNWATIIQAAATKNATWANDKNQLNIYKNDSNSYDYLYFNVATTGKTSGLKGRHTFKLNGGLWADNTKVYTISSPKSVASGGSIWFGGFKVYGFKVWDNGTLVVNLIPVIYEGAYGLWDLEREIFIANYSGTITGA